MAVGNTGKTLIAISFLTLGGCYVYVPVDGELPPSGKEVQAHLQPARDFAVGQVVVRDVTRIEGIMYIGGADTIAVWSNWFHTAFGTRFLGSNAVVYIPRSDIPQLDVRKVHPQRTVVALGVGAVVGVTVVNFLANVGGEQNPITEGDISPRVSFYSGR